MEGDMPYNYKVACLIWLLPKEAILTQENLMKGDSFMSQMSFSWRTSRKSWTFVPSLQDHRSTLKAIHKPQRFLLVYARQGDRGPSKLGRSWCSGKKQM